MFFTKMVGHSETSDGSDYIDSFKKEVAVNSWSGQYQTRYGSRVSPDTRHPKSLRTSQAEFDWVNNKNAFQRLRNLLTLEDNWDNYGAPPFFRPQVVRAFELYSNIYSYYLVKEINFSRLSPFIAPCSNGSILLEWAGQRFLHRELEIFVPSKMEDSLEFLKWENDLEEEDTFIAEEVNALLDWLFVTGQ
jgi:hypothetical protein